MANFFYPTATANYNGGQPAIGRDVRDDLDAVRTFIINRNLDEDNIAEMHGPLEFDIISGEFLRFQTSNAALADLEFASNELELDMATGKTFAVQVNGTQAFKVSATAVTLGSSSDFVFNFGSDTVNFPNSTTVQFTAFETIFSKNLQTENNLVVNGGGFSLKTRSIVDNLTWVEFTDGGITLGAAGSIASRSLVNNSGTLEWAGSPLLKKNSDIRYSEAGIQILVGNVTTVENAGTPSGSVTGATLSGPGGGAGSWGAEITFSTPFSEGPSISVIQTSGSDTPTFIRTYVRAVSTTSIRIRQDNATPGATNFLVIIMGAI